jgi:hypothetical protein
MSDVATIADPDAAIIAASKEWLSLYPNYEVKNDEFRSVAFRKRIDRMNVLIGILAKNRASTQAGMRAKAAVLRHGEGENADLALSIALDLA